MIFNLVSITRGCSLAIVIADVDLCNPLGEFGGELVLPDTDI